MTVKATTNRSSRKAAPTRKVPGKKGSIRVQKAEKPIADLKTNPDLETRIEDIAESRINDEAALMEMKDIENNMKFQNVAVGEMSMSVFNVKKELHTLTTLFKVTLGVGSVGVVLVVGIILRLTQYI
jgi:hypothetical protein